MPRSGFVPDWLSVKNAAAPMKKASAIVYSRPIWSDSQPKNGGPPVEDPVERQREHQSRHYEAEQLDRNLLDLEVLGNGRHGRRHRQAARGDHHEHHIEHVENRTAQDFGGRVAVSGLIGLHRHGQRLRGRGEQQPRHHEHDGALDESEHQEGLLVSRRIDHVRNRHDREGGSGAEPRGGDAGGETTPTGEPLERVADARAVDAAACRCRRLPPRCTGPIASWRSN